MGVLPCALMLSPSSVLLRGGILSAGWKGSGWSVDLIFQGITHTGASSFLSKIFSATRMDTKSGARAR